MIVESVNIWGSTEYYLFIGFSTIAVIGLFFMLRNLNKMRKSLKK